MKLKTRPGYLSRLGASLLVSVVALTAAACSSSEAGPTTEPTEGTRVVSHEFGETSVPGDFGRIVSIDEYAALGLLDVRSEEHKSELQSLMRLSYAVFCVQRKIDPHRTTKITHMHT